MMSSGFGSRNQFWHNRKGYMMASIKQRIETLEQEAGRTFSGYAVVCSWDYDATTTEDGIAAYVSANGPIPPDKQVVLIGWAV